MVIPQMKGDPLLESFLQIADKVAWEKYKSNFPKIDGILPIKHIKHGRGVLEVGLDSKQTAFINGTERLLKDIQPSVKS